MPYACAVSGSTARKGISPWRAAARAKASNTVAGASFGSCIRISHEQLDVAEGGIAIDDVDPLQLDLERTVDHGQRMRRPGGVQGLLVEARFDVVHRCP